MRVSREEEEREEVGAPPTTRPDGLECPPCVSWWRDP